MSTFSAPLIAPAPLEWPAPPEVLSFSALQELRACARRWAYAHARFSPGGLIDDDGRLRARMTWPLLRGRALHAALEALLVLHRRHGGPAAGSWELVRFWRDHLPAGGVVGLVRTVVQAELARASQHPRNQSIVRELRAHAAEAEAELVAAVNADLAQSLTGAPAAQEAIELAYKSPYSAEGRTHRRPLGLGTHPEVLVRAALAQGHEWQGVVDVIRVSADGIALLDYKTGPEKPWHAEQLELYALLFARDPVVNPAGRHASELLLIYNGRSARSATAPLPGRLAALAAALAEEGKRLRALLAERPPRASPSPGTCSNCTSRIVCDAYWSTQRPLAFARGEASDVELRVEATSPGGEEVTGALVGTPPARCRLLVSSPWRSHTKACAPGTVVRITGARVESYEEGGTEGQLIAVIGPRGEIVSVG